MEMTQQISLSEIIDFTERMKNLKLHLMTDRNILPSAIEEFLWWYSKTFDCREIVDTEVQSHLEHNFPAIYSVFNKGSYDI